MNPRYCNSCENFARNNPGGVELELALLFADIRGSTTIAQQIGPAEFSKLIDRFYNRAQEVIIKSDALIEKLVGDEICAFCPPNLTGNDGARKAIDTAVELL